MPRSQRRMLRHLDRQWQPPATIAVKTPTLLPRMYGRDSTTDDSHMVKIRLTEPERTAITNEADQLGLSFSAFVRWSALAMAHALHREREGHDDDNLNPGS